ncbi:ATP-dependent DNA helicase DinG [Neobacillus sp. SM06]|uniref:ATP-dependent DNA helicase DinG n=1 Tax=Neobacillus sp. SM06 TaxID=3422492 RepID=UPI003D2D3B82
MFNKFVVIDLETTGNQPKKGDRIIQFAAVIVENGKITDKFSTLVNPYHPIPPFIEELTGINNEMVQEAPEFAEIAPKVVQMLDEAYFVAHNVLFDLSFLQEELIQAGFAGFYGPVLDTVEMARILYPTADGYKLGDLAEMANIVHERPHQADSDAEVTALLLQLMLDRFFQIPRKTLTQLAKLSGGLKSDLDLLLESFLREKEKTIEELPASLEAVHHLILKKLPSLDIMAENSENVLEYPSRVEEKLALFEKTFAGFEKRSGQFQMMDEVYSAFQSNCHLLIEAGTGIGKSLGYLLPAAFFSIHRNQRVVISTHTTQLQEQLIRKEVPILASSIPHKIRVALLKGRNHYLDLEKFSRSLLDPQDNYDSVLTKMQILIWLTETETGDKDELNLPSGGEIFWDKVKKDDSKLRGSESWAGRDFYERARKYANHANLIITNHSLLLRDATERKGILPPFSYAVIDEGHHLEKAAATLVGESLDYMSVRLLLSQLGQYEQGQLFYKLERAIEPLNVSKKLISQTFEVTQLMTDLQYEMDEFFKLLASYVQKNKGNNQSGTKVKVRFYRNRHDKKTAAIMNSGERFAFMLKDLAAMLTERVQLAEKEKQMATTQDLLFQELTAFLEEIGKLSQAIHRLMLTESDMVLWIEVDFRAPQNTTSLYAQPASVAEYLQNKFFEAKNSIVLTSATLTVNQSFSYILEVLGLKREKTNVSAIPSPFPYKQQVQLYIPEDLPDIKAVSIDEYVIAITEQIITIAEATKGRMLLLFTSHEMLKKTYELIKESGFLEDFVLVAQGITGGSRSRLTRNFQKYDKAILLGTNSFWEGIDIPGEDLTCLIIVRLPFSPPNEPYTEAKCEYVKQRGGNPFMDYSLPEAILRFKQGFGRLIRTETDRGIIFVFDRRIITTKYGQVFLQSIPEIEVKEAPIGELVKNIHLWLS